MTIYGPTGTIVAGLPFGQRTEAPIAVDRNLGSDDFLLVFDGTPFEMEAPIDLFRMYPQETGTLLIKKRTGKDEAHMIIYRHVQNIAPRDNENLPGLWSGCSVSSELATCVPHPCRIVFDNALSAQDGGVANFNFVTAWKLPPEQGPYHPDDPRRVTTNLSTNTTASLYEAIEGSPYFLPVASGDGRMILVWAAASVDYQSGVVLAFRPTIDYFECLDDAQDPLECEEPEAYEIHLFTTLDDASADAEITHIYQTSTLIGEDPDSCGFPVRILSNFSNIFSGTHGDGQYIEDEISFEPGQHYFWVLYGRPVNPRIEKWAASDVESGGGFVDLPPYFGSDPEPTPSSENDDPDDNDE